VIGHEVDQPAIVSAATRWSGSRHISRTGYEARDVRSALDNEKPVAVDSRVGVEQRRGLREVRERCFSVHLAADACRDVVGRDDESADRGVMTEADDGEFERDSSPFATAAQ